jgi:hypothetical protein
MSQGLVETIVSKDRTHLATTEQGVDAGEGPSRKRSDRKPRSNRESEQGESGQQGGSCALRPHQATSENDPRLIALNKWGANLQKRLPRKIWTKPTILSDEPRDFAVWPLEDWERAA